jgi:hypothetical protein
MSTLAAVNPRLLALTEAGVSVWLDQIRRSMVEGGELGRMVVEECLHGGRDGFVSLEGQALR